MKETHSGGSRGGTPRPPQDEGKTGQGSTPNEEVLRALRGTFTPMTARLTPEVEPAVTFRTRI